MISIELARRLKQAGLAWHPAEHDSFMLPDRHMDAQVFVVSQLPALIQRFSGHPTITFHGSSEWALDHIMLAEAIWLPTESQIRERLAGLLAPDALLQLDRVRDGYRCQIDTSGEQLVFEATIAEDAYAQALLHLLERGANEVSE